MSHMPPMEFYLKLLAILFTGAVMISIVLGTDRPRKGK